LGLRLVGSLKEEAGRRVVTARNEAPFASTEDMACARSSMQAT